MLRAWFTKITNIYIYDSGYKNEKNPKIPNIKNTTKYC